MLYRFIVFMISCLLTFNACAQLELKIEPAVNNSQAFDKTIVLKSSFKSRQELFDYVQHLALLLQAKGYLSASVDSIAENDKIITAYLFWGTQYHWKELRIKYDDEKLINNLGYNFNSSKIIDVSAIAALPQKIINYYQNNGYPFARVKWDSIKIIDDNISASLQIDKGTLYKLDSIVVLGPGKISKNFLQHFLNLPQSAVYNQNVLENIDKKLLELNFIEQSQPWSITMQPSGYVLNFYFKPKRNNQVDALIGLLPANQQNAGKLLLTVDAKINLQNAFVTGEMIDFNWQQIQPKSPRLNLHYQQPYIFNSNFGLDLAFQLYKKDSAFLNIIGNIGLQYQLGDHQSATILLQTLRTNLLDIDTAAIKFSRVLPDIVDLSVNTVGVNYSYINTNYRYNPRRGTEVGLIGSAGNKTIRKNNTIVNIKDGYNYNKLYDSVKLNSYQVKLTANAAHYFPLTKQAVLKTAATAGFIQSPELFRNEMFQIGGYRLLRGFDEESIYANQFAVATIEYRYLTNLNSFFFGFSDVGWAAFKSLQTSFSHSYIGLGAGMAFQTKQGILNISYAVGKRDDVQFNLRESKIHLGYVGFF